MDDMEPIEIPIDGVLDLHTFHPRDVKNLVPDYIAACLERGVYQVRIIHGKGTGTLLRTVHSILEKMPEVISFRLAHEDRSGWGATLVELHNQEEQR
ncbi:MAG: Smr/MutS family protein [Desulfobulbaceae bacterium]|nr:Smr/MutS family protein [Desulfobulbaceae bacterium]